ncbi:MAG: hypothetical protein QOC99_3750 [Acidobacteriota bacterium]|jgi:hypothetical protein|nr:hypothetical protein [Acidobacteriota bacterium]
MTQPQGRGRRSRIVIDVERARAEGAQKGRRRRFGRTGRLLSVAGLIVAGVLLVLLVGSYAWWKSYKKSPAYSLALLMDAAQHDDIHTVESLIDADQIAQGFVPQIDNLTGANSALPPQARASLSTALPRLLPRVSETMRDEIMREVKGFSKDDSSSRLPFFVRALGVRQATSVTERGDAATVGLKAGDRPVELSMRREGDLWKIVTVKDEQLAGEIATRLASSLPAVMQAPPPQNQTHRRGVR